MVGTTLFDSIDRHDLQPAKFAEPLFGFYNRSAWPKCQRAREILEQWFSAYPEAPRQDLRSRFRSGEGYNHVGAFFELYCYALLTKQGFSVELHPNLIGGRHTHPDFKVSLEGESTFYFESTVTLSRDHVEKRYLDQVYDYLNRAIHAPNFFLHVSVLGDIPPTMPKLSAIRNRLHAWLSGLNADEVTARAVAIRAQGLGLDGLPRVVIEQDGWCIAFKATPVSPQSRGKPDHRPIGAITRIPESLWIDSQKPLLPALLKKAGDYGELHLPYIIAINSEDFTDQDHIANALFGKEGVSFNRGTGEATSMRFEDGLWTAGGGQFSRVSAVLVASLLGPLSMARQRPILWHNPWTAHPLDENLWSGPQMVADTLTGTMQMREGKSAWEILGVAPDELE